MGAYAIGDALTDEKLFPLCRDQGDAKGSLKFFVSHSSAQVHEKPLRPSSPTAVTILPPVLPYSNEHLPLGPKHRSRQESVSSASEQHPLETATGYEADLDNPERDSHRTAVHPSPPVATFSGQPPSPQNARRPNMPTPPSIAPAPRPPRSSTPPPSTESTVPEKSSPFVSPPPRSPNRPNFVEDKESLVPPVNRGVHGRSGSDAGAEREQALKASEQQFETASKQWRPRQPHASAGRLKTELSRDNLLSKESRRKRHNDLNDTWVVVSNDQDVSPSAQDSSRGTLSNIISPSRQQGSPAHYKPSYTRLAIPTTPRQAAPTVPVASNDARATPRPAGVPLPPGVVVAWRGEERGEQKAVPPSPRLRRLGSAAKSMDNLRASAYNHPTNLQPGGARRPPQLPMSRTGNVREQIPFSSNTSSSGLPKSYEAPRQPRPLPGQTSSYSTTQDTGQNPHGLRGTPSGTLISSREPYPRPQSALGDSLTSPPYQHPRQLQSPTYGNTVDVGEPIRSSRAISPSRPYYTGSKPNAVYGMRANPSSDSQSTAETSHSTPPISPRSLDRSGSEKPGGSKESIPSSMAGGTNNSNSSTESTLTQQDKEWLSNLVAHGSDSTLVPPTHTAEAVARPRSPPPTSFMSQTNSSTQYEDESDSGGDECGTMWNKPPMSESERPKSILRPPLKVQIGSSLATQQQDKMRNSDMQHATFATPPIPSVPPIPPPHRSTPSQKSVQGRATSRGRKNARSSTFAESSWAPRPPPEDVYERLEEFFPEHDLDKPLIEGSSGGTSPTIADAPAVPTPPVPAAPDKTTRVKAKKSIRIVAQEHKKLIDRTSQGDSSSYSNVLRKRRTKLWGSRLEEVTTAQAKSHSASTLPESSPGGPSKDLPPLVMHCTDEYAFSHFQMDAR
jgi:mitogen-activated protein kinase kinase kinase